MPVWKQAMCTRSGANDSCKQIFWMFVDQVYVIFFLFSRFVERYVVLLFFRAARLCLTIERGQ